MKNLKYILLILTFLALIVSYIGAKESFTWWLEVLPVFVGILFLAIFRKFEFQKDDKIKLLLKRGIINLKY